jgi:hypothetical protein
VIFTSSVSSRALPAQRPSKSLQQLPRKTQFRAKGFRARPDNLRRSAIGPNLAKAEKALRELGEVKR